MRPMIARAVRNLPLLVSIGILVFYVLTDRGVLTVAHTEAMFGVFVVVLLPASVLLLVIQAVLWFSSWRRGSDACNRDIHG